MKLGIFGVGYVGLVTAVCLADKGHSIFIHDTAKEKIATLQSGGVPIFEEGLEQILHQNRNRLSFTHDARKVISECEIIFICTGTPQDEKGNADLSQVESAVNEITSHSLSDKIIVIKSTVPPGTTEQMEQLANKQTSATNFLFVHNPEFLRQGKAVYDFMNPSRIILGASDKKAQEILKNIYSAWDAPILQTDSKSAELLKYAANSFLAMKISYINMISQLSDSLGTNIDDIASGIGLDPRIGSDFLKTGIGFGGSCFPKDLKALENAAADNGVELPFIGQTLDINEKQGDFFFEKIKAYGEDLKNKKITMLGLSFKPKTDDIRSAPSIVLSEKLLNEGARVTAFDPLVRDFPIEGVHMVHSFESAIIDTDITVIVTEWDDFNQLFRAENMKRMKQPPVIFDGRNMFTLEEVRRIADQHPLHYESIGRPKVSSLGVKKQIFV
ncbi:UDP-glucose dehydrogenase family protein [Fictibacillus halophilus]|uniref:UDP-glucose dehydrogenase family protein n=1 Tax=Fictibacillus halophilus TaxID=1610490 RepID=UPI001CFB4D6B|nr:UDP-glucose/GDP-mannose dehydrogenase family protein [Fictibacillus halophilus]